MARIPTERRRVPRLNVNESVTVTCLDDGREVQGRARNVSAGGIYVRCQGQLALGSRVQLMFSLETVHAEVGAARFRGKGRVVRVEEKKDYLGVAIQFDELTYVPQA